MSREEEEKPVTVKIIETVYVEADTADDFKSVVQRLTGKDAVDESPESWSSRAAQRIGAAKEGASHGDRKTGPSGTKKNG
ncbi:hypothetical protein ACP70R_039382 [Stipagrostis hirtigluma subsp. patula]